jgi:hypothetical protein
MHLDAPEPTTIPNPLKPTHQNKPEQARSPPNP